MHCSYQIGRVHVPFAHTKDNVAIFYETIGTGPRDVIFLHGWGGAASGHSWKGLLRNLDLSGLRAILVDLRGHGRSDQAPEGYSTEQFARDVFAVADHAKVDKLVVVAFSMSGKWALWMACSEPGRVSGQVLIAPAPATELPITEDMLQDWLKCSQDRSAWARFIRGFTKEEISGDDLAEYFKDVSTTSLFALAGTFHMCRTGEFGDRLKSLQTPTLVIGGMHDPMFPPQFLREQVTSRIPNARLALIDAGHEIPVEVPQQMAGLLEAFLAGLRE
jgi:pimeloyl-ACP methyl ester carboxylesterase